MKNFREQFLECKLKGKCETKKLEKPEIIETAFHGTLELNTVCWCKMFNHQCRSDVCKSYRESISLN